MIVECEVCAAYIESAEIGYFEYLREGEKPSGRIVLLKCRKCNSPILVSQDNIGNMCEGDRWDSPIKLYPFSDMHLNPSTPKPIKDAYEEAVRCFTVHAYTAAAILCRKTIEGICIQHGIKEANLVRSLKNMNEQGLIDDRLYEWADALRLAGNEAVHDVGVTVSREDAKDMLDFTNAIVDYLFSFRDKFERFKQRRSRREI